MSKTIFSGKTGALLELLLSSFESSKIAIKHLEARLRNETKEPLCNANVYQKISIIAFWTALSVE